MTSLRFALAAGLLWSASCALADPSARPMPDAALDQFHQNDTAPQAIAPLELESLSDDELEPFRGGQSVLTANQNLTASVASNTINGNVTTGAVTLSDNALSNFSGIGNFSINTGAQASLQSGMNLIINVGR